MAPLSNTGTAAAVHRYLCFREGSFYDHGIGDHADVGTESAQLNPGNILAIGRKNAGEIYTAEGGLVYDGLHIGLQFIADLPAGRIFDAVYDRKLFALLGMHIVCTVGIPGIDDRSIKGGNLLYHIGDDGCSMSTAETSGDEVILHIYYDQKIHKRHSCLTF